jgi:thiol-disulfide isomerase/thioredoxin
MIASRLIVASLLVSAITASMDISAEGRRMSHERVAHELQLPDEGPFPSLEGATEWLNSPPLTPAALRGKVVIVDFSTFTCINWLRTLPYVRAWAEKYKDHGLVVINVQTPEFEFEKKLESVHKATKDMTVDYPTAVDNDYRIWSAFNNHYWPALYIIDAKGRIRHHQFGEGDYERSEQVIQLLLTEAGNAGVGRDLVTVKGGGVEAAADWSTLNSPENYLGYDRAESFASPGGAVHDKPHAYTLPTRLGLNAWAFTGNWTIGKQATRSTTPNGKIVYRFHARDVHLVMGPATPGASVRFRVLIDGQPPRNAHGGDIDADGNGVVKDQRLYQLIRQENTITDRELEIEFLDPGVNAYVFTFG